MDAGIAFKWCQAGTKGPKAYEIVHFGEVPDHEAFPARTAMEKSEILEKVQEKQLEADWYLSNLSGYVAYLSWLRSGLVWLWSPWSWGRRAEL